MNARPTCALSTHGVYKNCLATIQIKKMFGNVSGKNVKNRSILILNLLIIIKYIYYNVILI